MHFSVNLPLDNQSLNLGLPHKQEEDEKSVQAVQDIGHIRPFFRGIGNKRDELEHPGHSHDNEKSKVQSEPNQRVSAF